MPLINDASRDQKLSGLIAYDHEKQSQPEFSEVFAASLGQVFDEELSISGALNREGWSDRITKVDAMIESGEISDPERYRRMEDRQIDYNEAATDLSRDDIKTDEQLNQDRNELLSSRRQYSEDVVSRGTGMAQFLGAMTGYMLDPINIATVGIAAPVMTAKSASVLGRAMMTSKNAALIGGGSELGIQTLVYQHKQAIDSPYGTGDALANIAFATAGASVLGFVTGGISGWLAKVLKTAEDLPDTPEVATAKEYLKRQQETLKGAPKVEDIELTDPAAKMQQRIEDDFDGEIARYSEIEDSEGGKVLNADIARELSDDYLKDRSLAGAVHEPSSNFIKRLYRKKLAEPPAPNETHSVLFTAGGTGAGKSTALKGIDSLAELTRKSQVIVDTTMSKPVSAMKKIKQALDANKRVDIVMVFRNPDDALINGALPRAMKEEAQFGTGRTIAIDEFVRAHVGSVQTIKQLGRELGNHPDITIKVVDNSRGLGKAAVIPIESLPDLNYTVVAKRAKELLENEHKSGKISDRVYQGFKGVDDGGRSQAGRKAQQAGRQGSSKESQQKSREQRQIDSDVAYLAEMDKRAQQYARPSKTPEAYEPRPTFDDKPRAAASQREHDILEAQGLNKALNDEVAKFNTLEKKMLQVDDELVDADALIKEFDEEIQGLDDVLKCAYG